MIRSLHGRTPQIDPQAYVDPSAQVLGQVEIGPLSSIWPGVVLRGDENLIRIGRETNIQDGTICHMQYEVPLVIGDRVTIGHGAIVHACTIGNDVRIGMGAIVLDGAVIEDGAQVGAGAVVSPGKRVHSGELWLGVPARRVRELSAEEQEEIRENGRTYVALWQADYADVNEVPAWLEQKQQV